MIIMNLKQNFIKQNKMKCVYCFLLTCFLMNSGSGEIYTSVSHIETSVKAARKLTENLMSVAKKDNTNIPNIEQFHSQLHGKLDEMKKYPERLTGHPIRVFRLFRNIYKFFKKAQSMVKQSFAQDLLKEVPTYTDLSGTVSGILGLQEIYKLKTDTVSQGIIADIPSFNLSASECFDIGVIAQKLGKNDLAHEWLQHAWKRVPESYRKDNTFIVQGLVNHTIAMGKYDKARVYANEWKSAGTPGKEVDKMVKTFKKQHKSATRKPVKKQNQMSHAYTRLCAEHDWVNPEWRELSCFMKDNNHPLLLLQPIKVEELKKDPYMVLFHDFFNDHEIENTKELAKPRLSRSLVRGAKDGNIIRNTRISKGVFLNLRSEVLQRLKTRVGASIGLNAHRGSEPFQVVNYGVGGFYTEHTDSWQQKESDLGADNRLATFLIYLSDVRAGGATVFTKLNLRIEAKKGSVAFWYNLHRNCRLDMRTQHAACPIMVGSKWIANFWIHKYWNEFNRPCGLSQFE